MTTVELFTLGALALMCFVCLGLGFILRRTEDARWRVEIELATMRGRWEDERNHRLYYQKQVESLRKAVAEAKTENNALRRELEVRDEIV